MWLLNAAHAATWTAPLACVQRQVLRWVVVHFPAMQTWSEWNKCKVVWCGKDQHFSAAAWPWAFLPPKSHDWSKSLKEFGGIQLKFESSYRQEVGFFSFVLTMFFSDGETFLPMQPPQAMRQWGTNTLKTPHDIWKPPSGSGPVTPWIEDKVVTRRKTWLSDSLIAESEVPEMNYELTTWHFVASMEQQDCPFYLSQILPQRPDSQSLSFSSGEKLPASWKLSLSWAALTFLSRHCSYT